MSQLRTRCDAHHKKALYNLRFSICNAATARSKLASSRPLGILENKLRAFEKKSAATPFEHPDPTVDVSAVPVEMGNLLAYDARAIRSNLSLLKLDEFTKMNIGVGNFTYTIGLFQLLSGEKRNLPRAQ